ncbi:unnamed protein product [Ectocarpus fasciculatus]
MCALQVSESDYFARRYIGSDQKHVLHGWNTTGKQYMLEKRIANLVRIGKYQQTKIGGRNGLTLDPVYKSSAMYAARASHQASEELQNIDEKWYDAHGNRIPEGLRPTPIAQNLDEIKKRIITIRTNQRNAMVLPDDSQKQASIPEILFTLRHAETCLRIATMIDKNRWDLPIDLR